MGRRKGKGGNKPQEPQQGDLSAAGGSGASQPPAPKGPPQKHGDAPPGQSKAPEQVVEPQGPPHQQQQRGPPPQQQQQWRAPQQQQQQRGPPQQQQQGGPPQQQWGQPPQQHQQWGHPQQQQQQQQGGPPQQQWGQPPEQQQQWGYPQQQQQQRGPQQQQQRGPPQQQQLQWGAPQQQQQRGPRQQQQQRGPPPQQQQQWGAHQQQQGGPPQQQWGPPPQQQQQWGYPQQQQQQRGPPQQQQQQRGPRQKPAQRPKQPRRDSSSSTSSSVHSMSSVASALPSPTTTAVPPVRATGLTSPPPGVGNTLLGTTEMIPGKKGRPIKIESNHLKLNLGKLEKAVHYDVTITPDVPKALMRPVMKLFGEKNYPNNHPAYDGRKNLYSPGMLPFGDSISGTVKVLNDNDKEKEFKVEIKFATYVDLRPLHDMMVSMTNAQAAVTVLDAVLRSAPASRCIATGRSFFTRPQQGRIIDLGQGMELYHGFFQSAIRGWSQTLLNVDVAHKAFPTEMNVLDLVCEMGSNFRCKMGRQDLQRGMDNYLQRDVEKFLRQLKVQYEIPGQPSSKKVYRVNGLGKSPQEHTFTHEGTRMTVLDYFKRLKRVNLQYPGLPSLWVGSRERADKILLPMEFCKVLGGQATNKKMNENQTSAMIKFAATNTTERKNKIFRGLQDAQHNRDPCIREFGFSVGDRFETLQARVLDPPKLEYGQNQTVNPSKGVWRSDRVKFLSGAQIRSWTVTCVTRRPPDMARLASEIYKFAPGSGIMLAEKAKEPFSPIQGRVTVNSVTDYFRKNSGLDLIFVVVPNSGPEYGIVKTAAEIKVGCLTQCIKERTLMRLNPQTVVNILLKVNSKMNGINHTMALTTRPKILSTPCMIMGADVTHPSPDAQNTPSVAAVTASCDPKALFQYNICWRLQPPKMEIIEDLCNIVKEQLMFFFKKNNGQKPGKIIFFRDGVSEGQFEQVQYFEIRAIQKACKEIQKDGYEPQITFVVVQKRHHTRLFPTNERDSDDRNFNVPAGTCVDTQIVSKNVPNFYLVSHASIQGVAKPTKYCTIWDDNNIDTDDMEALTYHLCHMYTRCNRSVSYPAPTYYAHLAAARAKAYIGENDVLDMTKLKDLQERNYSIQDCIRKGKPMFFV